MNSVHLLPHSVQKCPRVRTQGLWSRDQSTLRRVCRGLSPTPDSDVLQPSEDSRVEHRGIWSPSSLPGYLFAKSLIRCPSYHLNALARVRPAGLASARSAQDVSQH